MKLSNACRARLIYFSVFSAIFVLIMLIALFVHDGFVRPYLGDVIVVGCLYSFLRIIFPSGVRLLPAYVLALSFAVEAAQYFDLLGLVGLGGNRALRIIFGASFSHLDLVCYFVGFLCVIGAEWAVKMLKSGRQAKVSE